MTTTVPRDAIVVGGVAGHSAATFTARHGLDTLLVDAGESVLRRNAHIENFPGFPSGVDPRLLLETMGDQAENAGCERLRDEVRAVTPSGDGFAVETGSGDRYRTQYVIAAIENTTGYLEELDDVGIIDRRKRFIDTDERPFYHDWVVPDGYFTDRGRDLSPGCEELGEEERRQREEQSPETMRARFVEPHPDEQVTHPSLRDRRE